MRAIVWQGPERMAIEERPEPPDPEAGELILRPEAVGICGSEIEGYLGRMGNRTPPLVMGHEFAGVVVAGGPGAEELEGARVTVNPLSGCGKCALCRDGHTNLCADRVLIGVHAPGAFADLVRVPASDVRPLPDGVSARTGALVEPLANGVHAVRLGLSREPVRRAVVLGGGTIGLVTLQAALLSGIEEVALLELQPERRERAAALGAHVTYGSEEEALAAGPADLVIDAVGAQAARSLATRLVRPAGQAVFIGLAADDTTIGFHDVVRSQLTLQGSYAYTMDDFEQALEWLVSGQASLRDLPPVRPLDDRPRAVAPLARGPPPARGKGFLGRARRGGGRPAAGRGEGLPGRRRARGVAAARAGNPVNRMSGDETSELQQRTMKRVAARLMPALLILYIIAYLDRVNVTFAQDKLESDLGFSGAVYGFGAGVFFIAYFFLEVPSNLALHKFGARKWIARIMFTWGIISACTALVQGPASFYLVRFLLGAAEAGFFPGMILYLSYWFPARERARAIGFFMSAIAISYAIGAPISGGIMSVFGGVGGLEDWQWLFLIEAIPALIASVFVLLWLDDGPEHAKWLPDDERRWLAERLEGEEEVRLTRERHTVSEALKDRRVLLFGLLYFCMVVNVYGISFWVGEIVDKVGGLNDVSKGFVTAIPYTVAIVGLVLISRHSDRTGSRKPHVAVALALGAIAFALSTVVSPVAAIAALAVGLFFLLGAHPVFWAMPAALLSGPAAPAGGPPGQPVGQPRGVLGPRP